MVEISKLFWKQVYTSDKFLLGEIQSAELDMNTWQITNLYVALTDETTMSMGFKRPWLGKIIVCLPVSVVESFEETVNLKETRENLQKLRQCKE